MNHWKLRLRKDYARVLYRAHLAPAFWRPFGSNLTILNYHQFVSRTSSNFLQVSHSSLLRQLDTLQKISDIVPLSNIFDGSLSFGNNKSHRRPTISVTIDDGDRSVLDVLSIFGEFSIPITIFLPMGLIINKDSDDGCRSILLRYRCLTPKSLLISELKVNKEAAFEMILSASMKNIRELLYRIENDSSHRYVWPRKLLTVDDIKILSENPLVTIASHSMSHLPLSVLPKFLLEWEIEKSIDWIRQFGGDTTLFAYPYGVPGTYNQLTNSKLRMSGVRFAFNSTSFPTSLDTSSFVFGRSFVSDSCDGDYIGGLGYGAFEIWDRIRYSNYFIRSRPPWYLSL